MGTIDGTLLSKWNILSCRIRIVPAVGVIPASQQRPISFPLKRARSWKRRIQPRIYLQNDEPILHSTSNFTLKLPPYLRQAIVISMRNIEARLAADLGQTFCCEL